MRPGPDGVRRIIRPAPDWIQRRLAACAVAELLLQSERLDDGSRGERMGCPVQEKNQ